MTKSAHPKLSGSNIVALRDASTEPAATKAAAARKNTAPSRTTLVHQALRQAIFEQQLRPGARLPEDAIGEVFGASRTIAREAFGRLAVEGLVELQPNRGAFVANPSLDEGRDVFQVRRGLERIVVQSLSGKLARAQIEELHAFMKQEAEVSRNDALEAIRLAGEFHILLARMTGNTLLVRYVTELVSRCSLILAMYGRPHSAECGINEHVELVETLVAGDEERACSLMDRHLKHVASRALLEPRMERDIRDVLAPYATRKAEKL